MLGIHDFWLFLVTAVLLNLAPGQDTVYILGRGISQGRRIGIASALGVSAGGVIHTFAAALGFSAIIASSASAFFAVKLLGAIYLVYLGVRMLRAPSVNLNSGGASRSVGVWVAFRQGVLSNVLIPKVALFFLALMPQFIDQDSAAKVLAFVVLGLTFVATGTAWCLTLAIGASHVRRYFAARTSALATIYRVTGLVFIGLGLRLAASRQ